MIQRQSDQIPHPLLLFQILQVWIPSTKWIQLRRSKSFFIWQAIVRGRPDSSGGLFFNPGLGLIPSFINNIHRNMVQKFAEMDLVPIFEFNYVNHKNIRLVLFLLFLSEKAGNAFVETQLVKFKST